MTDYLVPGRTCGTCTACCVFLQIESGGIEKPAGVACRHLTECSGCAIYADRPQVCRSYNCLWRSVDALPEDWRPDRSGILMQLDDLPAGPDDPFSVLVILIGPPELMLNERFAALAGGFIESGTALHLTYLAEPGRPSLRLLLNPIIGPAITARNLAEVQALLLNCYRSLEQAKAALPPAAGQALQDT
ncbi:MAG: YkgJ family cysteine cluster protein [Sandaracinobacteroides sp.]